MMLKLPVPPVDGKPCTSGDTLTMQALTDVSNDTLHTPAMLPDPAPSLTTYSLHIPFGGAPNNDPRVVPVGAPDGAGGGKISPGS